MSDFIKLHYKKRLCLIKEKSIVAVFANDNNTNELIVGDDLAFGVITTPFFVDETPEEILEMVNSENDFIELHNRGKLCLIKKGFIAGVFPNEGGRSEVIVGDDLGLMIVNSTFFVDETPEKILEMINPEN